MSGRYEHCGRGICAANAGHPGSCAAASGWAELYECDKCESMIASDRPVRLVHLSDGYHEMNYIDEAASADSGEAGR